MSNHLSPISAAISFLEADRAPNRNNDARDPPGESIPDVLLLGEVYQVRVCIEHPAASVIK